MKIGILTFHKSINNGAVMQCYSLVKRLQKEFPKDSVEVINYHMPKMEKYYTPSLRNYLSGGSFIIKVKKLLRYLQKPKQFEWEKKRKKAFESVENILPLSKHYIFNNNPNELFQYISENYDICIAGSDAIWNYVLRGFPNPYFLDNSVKCKKFSYAASCYGMSYENIPSEQKDKIKEILNDYCFLGTRDIEAEKFVDYIGSSTLLAHTCDPTVFLDVNDLPVNVDNLVNKMKKKGFNFSKKTIAVMGTNEMCKMIRQLYGKDVQIAALYNFNKDADVNLYDLTPYEWAYVFRYFCATVTTYFHGTHLSLRNGVPVVAIALETEYSKNHKTKVLDFLERLGLEKWYVHSNCKDNEISKIKVLLDDFLNENNLHDDIIKRMDIESFSFNNFLSVLKKEVNSIKEN